MAGRTSVKITLGGADKILRQLHPDELWKHPVGRLLDEARERAEDLAHQRAPRGVGGQLDAGIGSELRATADPPYALVKAEATADGFRYPYALDASDRYHYRAGALGKKGRMTKGSKPTKGWMSKIPGLVRRVLRSAQRKAEQQIEQRWGR